VKKIMLVVMLVGLIGGFTELAQAASSHATVTLTVRIDRSATLTLGGANDQAKAAAKTGGGITVSKDGAVAKTNGSAGSLAVTKSDDVGVITYTLVDP